MTAYAAAAARRLAIHVAVMTAAADAAFLAARAALLNCFVGVCELPLDFEPMCSCAI